MDRSNNFDFLRFAAASLVLFSHCYQLLGIRELEPVTELIGYKTGGKLAVAIFFVISGFLVTASFLNTSGSFRYLRKRALRLFPGLCFSVLFTVFIIGPSVTKLPLSSYFSSSGTYAYLLNILMFTKLELPRVFASNPYPDVVNGPLWSIPVEGSMYLLVMILGWSGLLNKRYIVYVLLVFMLLELKLLGVWRLNEVLLLGGAQAFYFCQLALYFFSGAALYLFRAEISYRADISIFFLGLLWATFHTPLGPLAMQLTLPYLVLHFAHLPLGRLSRFGTYGDFSYGIYVFAFPLQQCIMFWLGPSIGIAAFIGLSFAATLILAVFSWYFIESPALRLK